MDYPETDTLEFLSLQERELIIKTLNFAETGFSNEQQKYSLITEWNNLPDKYLDGIMSGGIISILIYSDCYWKDFKFESTTDNLENRFINIALVDVSGGALSFLSDVITGHYSGYSQNPEAGLEYLKRAGMNALRSSAGPFGVLF